MRTFIGVAILTLGLLAIPVVSDATPFGTNQCVQIADGSYDCDIFADFDDGVSLLGAGDGNPGLYLVGYTFLFNFGADLSTLEESDVAHILVIHDQLFELFSNIASNLSFSSIFTAASTAALIDGLNPNVGQFAGCPPIPGGVPSIGSAGYCTTGADVTAPVNWGLAGDDPIGGLDMLSIHTQMPVDEGPESPVGVPEPSSLSMLALGGVSLLLRRRKTTPHVQ